MLIQIFSLILIFLLLLIFYMGGKSGTWESSAKSIFECGYTSYFFSRFSFSVQYFLVALTFLLLDLEVCFLLPFFNEESMSIKISLFFFFVTLVLTMALLFEWNMGMLDWKK